MMEIWQAIVVVLLCTVAGLAGAFMMDCALRPMKKKKEK